MKDADALLAFLRAHPGEAFTAYQLGKAMQDAGEWDDRFPKTRIDARVTAALKPLRRQVPGLIHDTKGVSPRWSIARLL